MKDWTIFIVLICIIFCPALIWFVVFIVMAVFAVPIAYVKKFFQRFKKDEQPEEIETTVQTSLSSDMMNNVEPSEETVVDEKHEENQ